MDDERAAARKTNPIRSSLLRRPAEIRNQIYENLLTHNTFLINGHRYSRYGTPPFLNVCQQMQAEATEMWLSNTRFLVSDVSETEFLSFTYPGWYNRRSRRFIRSNYVDALAESEHECLASWLRVIGKEKAAMIRTLVYQFDFDDCFTNESVRRFLKERHDKLNIALKNDGISIRREVFEACVRGDLLSLKEPPRWHFNYIRLAGSWVVQPRPPQWWSDSGSTSIYGYFPGKLVECGTRRVWEVETGY